jgi:Flp pilus assembly protein TadG
MFIFLITVDFARIFYFSQIIENCARNGALYASDPTAQVQSPYANVTQAALARPDASNLNPQPTVAQVNGNDASGNAYVQVNVAWQFQTIASFPGIPNTFNLSRTVQMRVAP